MAGSRVKTERVTVSKGAASARSSGRRAKRTAVRKTPAPFARGLNALRSEVKTLKKLVLLQKVKRDLLQRETIGPAEIDVLLADYLKVILTLTGTAAGSILLQEDNQLVFRVSRGSGSQRLAGRSMPVDEGIAGWAAANDQPALVNDVENAPRYFKKAGVITRFVTRNMVCVPVRSKGRVIGVLQAINKKNNGSFGEKDLENCAITTDRPYRKAADLDAAMKEISKFSGKEFDPALVGAFLEACKTGDIVPHG